MASMKRDAEHSLRQVISASSPFVYLHMKSFTRLSTMNVHCSLRVRLVRGRDGTERDGTGRNGTGRDGTKV
ncbi:hypothetical protein DVH24_016392 [Malus domestica]|uniref:Uncharacterized protein n=1 Tax=Malus domestica TaxID=3750 RepID=A0A498HS48_MALDO|nr:hypothetical protein DVH24_016392 [Malus domestica]